MPFAMARDGYFFKAMAEVHPRFHTPSVALMVQLGLSILLLLFAGKLPPIVLAGHFRGVAVLHVRGEHGVRAAPQGTGCAAPYRMWGYPVVPALFVAAAAVLLYYTFTENMRNSAVGLAVILAGVPVYCTSREKKNADLG